MGSVVFAIRWNAGQPPGVTQPEKLATMIPVGGPLLLWGAFIFFYHDGESLASNAYHLYTI